MNSNVDGDLIEYVNAIHFFITNLYRGELPDEPFDKINAPLLHIKVREQTNRTACGYFLLRNVIGLCQGYQEIFPIKRSDILTQDLSNWEDVIVATSEYEDNSRNYVSKITDHVFMKYSVKETQKFFIKEVKTLMYRLYVLDYYITLYRNTTFQQRQFETIKRLFNDSITFYQFNQKEFSVDDNIKTNKNLDMWRSIDVEFRSLS